MLVKYRVITLLLLFFLFLPATAFSKDIYTIARAPQSSFAKTEKNWTPYVQYLNKTTGYSFKLKLYRDRDKFEEDISEGKVDFFYGNPGYAVLSHLKHGYQPILRSSNNKLQGIVVALKESDINSAKDLQNKKLVFPGKTAFAATLLVQHHLNNDHKIFVDNGYVFGHDNVYRNVLNGNYIAGGGVQKTLNKEPEGLKNKLKVVFRTPEISPHPLSVHPAVPDAVKNSVINMTFTLKKSEEGKKLLKSIKLTAPVKINYKQDYSSLEPLTKIFYKHLLVK